MTPDVPNSACEAVKVLLNLSLDRTFDYFIPPALRGRIQPGMRVSVPFGKSKKPRSAYVAALVPRSERNDLKPVLAIEGDDERPLVTPALARLGDWMADYYCCTREQAFRSLLPGAVRNGRIRPKTVKQYYLADAAKAEQFLASAPPRQKKRADLVRLVFLQPGRTADFLLAETGASAAQLAGLVKNGMFVTEKKQAGRDPFRHAEIKPTRPLDPTPGQKAAIDMIQAALDAAPDPSVPHTILLHGVTCSGKTEVYLQSIAHVLEKGGDAVVLVPEISLTPQTVLRFRARFGEQVSVLHSGLTDGERFDEWMKVHAGKVRIAVGARSALFAPFRNLKLIIVDEEHETSYKQSEAPRYNARDVAVVRGRMEGAVVVLGSATPSMESYRNALEGKYRLAVMPERCDPSVFLPEVHVADMRLEANEEEKIPFFSKELISAVRERLSRKEQCILFLNKRGYSRQMQCDACGFVPACENCSVAYTYHRRNESLVCHYCGDVLPAPERCPQCGSDQIRYSGAGTERIESLALKLFPNARIVRMDSDTMSHPAMYEKVLGAFRRGELDILIGTQMIAKGLDFPNVTLVGVMNADTGLMLPDFRAQERGFQLLEQVAGRAGRGFTPGLVIIQTFSPFNPAIECARTHDYRAFFDDELVIRKDLNFPPFTHLTALHFEGDDPSEIMSAASSLVSRLRAAFPDSVEISDPAPAPIERMKGKCRWMSLARGANAPPFRARLREEAMAWRRNVRNVVFYADVDAISLL